MADTDADPKKETDLVVLHSPTEDGEGVRVLRARQERIELGELRPLKEGAPILSGEVVRLKPRPDLPVVCDVEVLVAKLPEKRNGGTGPAQVATRAYRDNWDAIFGLPEDKPAVLN